jgi:hypothetical protein
MYRFILILTIVSLSALLLLHIFGLITWWEEEIWTLIDSGLLVFAIREGSVEIIGLATAFGFFYQRQIIAGIFALVVMVVVGWVIYRPEELFIHPAPPEPVTRNGESSSPPPRPIPADTAIQPPYYDPQGCMVFVGQRHC